MKTHRRRSRKRQKMDKLDVVFEAVITSMVEIDVRKAVSLVCSHWKKIESESREHVTVTMSDCIKPAKLIERFPNLKSLKLKGRPKNLFQIECIPENWGGMAEEWLIEICNCESYRRNLKSLHLDRMIITDEDLHTLALSVLGKTKLEVLKLTECSGFSTDGLSSLSTYCRLKTLSLEGSDIDEKDGEWLTLISVNNHLMENLNFFLTDFSEVKFKDLEVIACRLKSVKTSMCNLLELRGFFRNASVLEAFAGGALSSPPESAGEDGINEQMKKYGVLSFPKTLQHLGLVSLRSQEIGILYSMTHRLKTLDLKFAILDTAGYCILLQRCPNLDNLEALTVIADTGLETVAQFCKKLKKITIEKSTSGELVTNRGVMALARECRNLEHMSIRVFDITNEALVCVGTYLKKLRNLLLFLIEDVTDFPLDLGIRSLLNGCQDLIKFGLSLEEGRGITDVGLGYIGQCSGNIRWMMLAGVGETDDGLIAFSRGCPHLEKLDIMGPVTFSEKGIATAVVNLKALRYLWVYGYIASEGGRDILAMTRPYWKMELIPVNRIVTGTDSEGEEEIYEFGSPQILAYYSLVE